MRLFTTAEFRIAELYYFNFSAAWCSDSDTAASRLRDDHLIHFPDYQRLSV